MSIEDGAIGVTVSRVARKYDLPRDSKALAGHYLGIAEGFLLAERGKVQFPPCFMLFSETQEISLDASELVTTGDEKDVLVSLARMVAKEVKAVASVFLSEVWLSVTTQKEYEEALGRGREILPSQRPDRQECLMAAAEYAGMKPEISLSVIVRNSMGEAISFKPSLVQGVSFAGRFAGILG